MRVAVDWVAEQRPDLVVLSGDLVSRPRGEPVLRELLARLPGCFAILGNHDLAIGRDPLSRPVRPDELEPAVLLFDEGRMIELRDPPEGESRERSENGSLPGRSVAVVGLF